jgi:hypothetical protein
MHLLAERLGVARRRGLEVRRADVPEGGPAFKPPNRGTLSYPPYLQLSLDLSLPGQITPDQVPLNKKIIIIIIKVGCLGVMIGVF